MQIKDEHGIYEGTLIENEIMKFKSELYIIHILIKVYRKNKGKERIFLCLENVNEYSHLGCQI